MLLYKDADNRFLAVAPHLRLAETNGFRVCHEGRPIPPAHCLRLIRRHGGAMLTEEDEISLDGETLRYA